MRQLPTLTVGIPAYNEGQNIAGLLKELLLQRADSFSLKKIIVTSDGSADNTVDSARSIGSTDLIEVLDNHERKGLGPRLNQLMEMSTTDMVVLLNADILIESRNFLELITAPIRENRADLVSCNMLPMDPKTAVEKSFVFGYGAKNKVFEHHSRGINAFTCHGAARAMSRVLYTKLRFPTSVGEDTYSYLFAIANDFQYAYVHAAAVYIRLPQTLHDQLRQSMRFYNNEKLLSQYFLSSFVRQHLHLPYSELILELVRRGLGHPLSFLHFLILQLYIRLQSQISVQSVSQTWDIPQTSKSVRV